MKICYLELILNILIMRISQILLIVLLCLVTNNLAAQKGANQSDITLGYSEEERAIFEKMRDNRLDFAKPISSDSLNKVLNLVDKLSFSEISIVRESYTYRKRVSPIDHNIKIYNKIDSIYRKMTN